MQNNKKWRHTIQITNDRQVYILPLVNYNVYLPIIGHLYCMTSFFLTLRCFRGKIKENTNELYHLQGKG